MRHEQQVVEQAGGEFLGIEGGLVYFNDPETHTTMTAEQVIFDGTDAWAAAAHLKLRLAMKRGEFAATSRGTQGGTHGNDRLRRIRHL